MVRSTFARRILPAALLLLAAFVVYQNPLRDGEDLLIQRRYADAAKHLQKALEDGLPAADRDRAMLLLGRAQWLAKDVQAAVATYRRLETVLPGSPLLHKARFQRAEALASAGDHRAAAPIYQAEIERLVGLSRKEEVATTYLGLAEKALAGSKPDHNRAVAFFDLALDLGLSEDRARAVRLQAAEARLAAKNFGDAQRRFTPLAKTLTVPQGRLRAMLGLGRARWRAGNRSGARTILRDLIQLAPRSAEAGDAAYEIALTYHVPKPGAAHLDRAVAALARLRSEYPEHKSSKIAWYLTAQCYASAGRGEAALRALRSFLAEDRSDLPEVPLARAMIGDVLHGQGKRAAATQAWREFLKSHPSHRDWERVQRAIVTAEYGIAMALYEKGEEQFEEVRKKLAAFSRSYPIDSRNPDILFLFGEMEFRTKKYDAAREAYARCVSKYPRSNAASHAQYRIGEIYETRTFNYQQALDAYGKVRHGSWRSRAQARIARLTRKSMALFTPRTYRTGEKAVFQLTSRNIEKVRVRVFKLDMETYFRSTHTSGAVDKLDIEVIEPDKVFESAVPEYLKHRETARDVDIGFDAPGAYVVKVDDREFEATTMVLVSDIAVIAKSSRHEFFVFTQNRKEARVESGVKVMLSDGAKIVAEGKTGEDGVWRYKGDALKSTDRLRVFAVNAAGSGASDLQLSGLGYSQGLVPKCYIFTDRPVYQPGQRVHIKGIVREVKDGLYRIPQGADYGLQVLSASGQLVLQRDVELSEFGTFTADLGVPPAAVLGKWRVRVFRSGGQSFGGEFEVARYQRPRVRLVATPKQRVVYRGEKIEGVLKLDYFFGEPAVGKTVHYSLRLPDGGLIERHGETNASGEVEFSFETKEFGEEAMATIQARVDEENARTALVVPVVTTEFTPTLSLVRAVYLAGEPFEVTLSIKDRAGKPLARPGTVRLLRAEGTEVQVDEQGFETAAETGTTRVAFRAEKGGRYLVRVSATDRFGTIVTAQVPLRVSGEDDENRLRLLTDRQNFKVGERMQVRVVNRAGPKLVLQTLQGDGILSYESRRLPEGVSTLAFELRPEHAPNFGLALAMMDGQVLRTAQREFRVTRDLQVRVRPTQAVVRPGETVEVEVETLDPKGRPVAAEVALSLVDEALLSQYPDQLPKLGPFFYGKLRQTTFRTVSSCTWSYRGAARKMSAALLAEERRMDERRKAAAERPTRTGSDEFFMGSVRRPTGPRTGGAGPGAPGPAGPATPGADPRRSFGRNVPGKDANRDFQTEQVANGARGIAQRVMRYQNVSESEEVESAFASDQWQRAVGLGGGAGERAPMDGKRSGPRTDLSSTGAWVPRLTTGADGKARIELRLPENTTSYKVTARGVTRDTYVGEGTAVVRANKDLQVGLVVPFALVEGDEAKVATTVHNLTKGGVDVRVEFESTQGEIRGSAKSAFRVPGQREENRVFGLVARGDADLKLRLAAASAALRDEVVTTIPVQPFGAEYRDGRSGHTTGTSAFQLSLPKGREYSRLEMLIEIGRDPGADLVKAALGVGFRPMHCRRVDLTNHSVSSRGLAALIVLDYLERVGRQTPADSERLRRLVTSALSRLVTAQGKDGGLPWIGKRTPDFRSTCQSVLFLSLASRRGFAAAAGPLNKAAEWLLRRTRRARVEDRVRAAWALASMPRKRVDYSTLNALHRNRTGMSSQSLAHLALAWQAFGRKELGAEALSVLRPRVDVEKRKPDVATTETMALAAAAFLANEPRDATGRALIEWLSGRQTGVSYGTPAATAAALRALVAAGGREMAAASTAEVKVEVNGRLLATVPASVKDENTRFPVPKAWLRPQDNDVRISVAGRGKVHFTSLLNGFARGFRSDDRSSGLRQPDRAYYPALRRHKGKVLQPGFGVVTGSYRSFTNKLTKLNVGESGRVHVSFHVDERNRQQLSPIVLEEWIPAGCTVQRESVTGNFDHVVVEPNRMTFYFGETTRSCSVTYEMHGRIPGTYKVLPTKVYGARRPDLISHGKAGEFRVLPRGSEDRDVYRETPDELYNLGRQLFDAAVQEGASLEPAGERLDRLLADWHKTKHHLRDHVYKEVARMMLFVSIQRKDSKAVVRFFEVLKDQYPELVIPFDKIVAVGKAYRDIGEFEQSVMVFRAAAESSFLKEAAVANTLETMGEVRASLRFLRTLLLSYPDLNTMRTGLYSIGQKLAALAAAIPDGAKVDPKVGRREVLRAAGNQVFREFLVLYPEDPIAEEVSFAWATTCVEGKDLDQALAVSRAALARYPDSSFADELLYTVGFAQFAKGEHEAAFQTLQRVATETFTRPTGGKGVSENKFHAIYLQGQIHHARGEPAKALAAYKLVEKHFSDASEASDYFLRKALALPEVTTFKVGAEAAVEVSFRNIPEIEVKVYRVDLMRLYLMQKSLNNIRGIQLHGIRPFAETKATLGDGRDYRTKSKKLALPLKEPGAYLVVARGGNHLATGMVLCSDLSIEAQEFLDVGRIRVNVKGKAGYESAAHVKVIGAGDKQFRSGETDLRGIFVGASLVGEATVIVKKGNQYAFYRGKGVHQPGRYRPPAPQPRQAERKSKSQGEGKGFKAWDNNFRSNGLNRGRQVDWLKRNVLQNKQKGVEVYRAK